MSEIQFPTDENYSYIVQFGIRIEPDLKSALEEIKEHAKRTSKKDVNEAIRIQLRKIVQAYWAENQRQSA